MNSMFVYNGNSHFIVILSKSDSITAEDAVQTFSAYLDNRESCENVDIKYEVGVAETFRERVKSARALLVESIKNRREFESKAKED